MIEAGQEAPDFTLPGIDRRPVRLSTFRGRNVVLAFFPGAFTPVCLRQFTDVAAQRERYAAADAAVIAVSVDSTATLGAFAERLGSPDVTFLADFHPKGEVSRAYGVYLEDYGTTTRAVFVIDRDGVVRGVEAVIPPELPDEEAVFAALAACPA